MCNKLQTRRQIWIAIPARFEEGGSDGGGRGGKRHYQWSSGEKQWKWSAAQHVEYKFRSRRFFLFCFVALIDFNPFLYFELKRDFFFLDRMQSGFLPRSSMHNCFWKNNKNKRRCCRFSLEIYKLELKRGGQSSIKSGFKAKIISTATDNEHCTIGYFSNSTF